MGNGLTKSIAIVSAGLMGMAAGSAAPTARASEPELRFPAGAAVARTQSDPPAHLQPGELEATLGGPVLKARLGDSRYSYGGNRGQRCRAHWPDPKQTGAVGIPGPDGPAVRFITAHARVSGVAPLGSGPQWTLTCWVRPDEGDWGNGQQPDGKFRVVRPELFGLRDAKGNPLWTVRLCRMRPEVHIGSWVGWADRRLHLGRWAHLAVVRDGKGVRVYVDGILARLTGPLRLDEKTQADLDPGAVPAGPPAAAPAGPFDILSFAGHPQAGTDPDEDLVWLCDKFVGALGGVRLRAGALTEPDIKAEVARGTPRKLDVRYTVLADPVAGARSRRPEMKGETAEQYRERMAGWRTARYGLFMHWGVNTTVKSDISWPRGDTIPKDVYDALYKRFNPTKFDPAGWAAAAKAAGFRYAILTAKHHDGFCLWPTDTHQYNVAATPFGKDVVGPYLQAFHKAGLRAGLYFSSPDWWNDDRLAAAKKRGDTNLPPDTGVLRKAQLAELASRYGRIDVLWFDGPAEFGSGVGRQPSTVVNDGNRSMGGDYISAENFPSDGPCLNPDGTDAPWEFARTTGGAWGYALDRPELGPDDVVRTLAAVAGTGGNLLLNVAPRADGQLPATHTAMLKQAGVWLRANAAAVYETHRVRLGYQGWGWATAGKDVLYLHVLRPPPDGRVVVRDWHDRAIRASLLAGGEALKVSQAGDELVVQLPAGPSPAPNSVIAVQVEATR